MSKHIRYTDAMLEWVQDNQADITRKQLTERFNERFNMQLGRSTLWALCKRRGWMSNNSGRIEKGAIPWNKGKRGYMGANATSFKKGQMPKNHKPVGSTRICSKDGYILVKTSEPNTWQLKHVLVWESVNGKIPDGHVIRLLDGDKTNCEIDNLLCISRGAHATSNCHNKADTSNPDLNRAILLTQEVKQVIRSKT